MVATVTLAQSNAATKFSKYVESKITNAALTFTIPQASNASPELLNGLLGLGLGPITGLIGCKSHYIS